MVERQHGINSLLITYWYPYLTSLKGAIYASQKECYVIKSRSTSYFFRPWILCAEECRVFISGEEIDKEQTRIIYAYMVGDVFKNCFCSEMCSTGQRNSLIASHGSWMFEVKWIGNVAKEYWALLRIVQKWTAGYILKWSRGNNLVLQHETVWWCSCSRKEFKFMVIKAQDVNVIRKTCAINNCWRLDWCLQWNSTCYTAV